MKAKELRIGNYVNFKFHKDCGGVKGIEVFISDLEIILHNNSKSEYYTPITLTEGWLVKFGFEKYKDTFQFKIETIPYWSLGKEKQGCLKIYLTKTKKWKVGNLANKSIDIYSVHQLQNLYFALTDKELKINKI